MSPCPSIQTAVLTGLLLLPPMAAQGTCLPGNIPASTPTSQFTDHGDGTVTDQKTKLMWKRCSEGQSWEGAACAGAAAVYTWPATLEQAQADGFAGHDDWRLPNSKELASIVEEQCVEPASKYPPAKPGALCCEPLKAVNGVANAAPI